MIFYGKKTIYISNDGILNRIDKKLNFARCFNM